MSTGQVTNSEDISSKTTTTKDDSLAAKAKLLEGVDFIENEEDVEAVESAVVKIQSTFRGKKIRSKLNAKTPTTGPSSGAAAGAAAAASKDQEHKQTDQDHSSTSLNEKLATMDVNDKTNEATSTGTSSSGAPTSANSAPTSTATGSHASQVKSNANLGMDSSLAEDEVERAATRIQAGYKGYKTRKELAEEGKLTGANSASSNQDHHH